jgi:hypothetical protein
MHNPKSEILECDSKTQTIGTNCDGSLKIILFYLVMILLQFAKTNCFFKF